MIDLASATVCPVVEISSFNPCIVRLDPTKITLSALSDYYLAVFFTASDSNNNSIGLTEPQFQQSSLRGTYISGDETRLTVGATIPSSLSFSGQPYSLMYVMTDQGAGARVRLDIREHRSTDTRSSSLNPISNKGDSR